MDVTAEQVREVLRRECQKHKSQAAWAKLHGISGPYVADVLSGKRDPGEKILAALGMERVVTYRKVSGGDVGPRRSAVSGG